MARIRFHRFRSIFVALVALALVAGACSSSDEEASPPGTDGHEKRIDIDPADYVNNYDEDREGEGATAPVAVETADAGAGAIEPLPIPPPGVTDANTFVDPGEATWTATAEDAQSTFGLDVDTGSFTVARRFAAEGYRPPPESVRPEEWINALVPAGAQREDTGPESMLAAESELTSAGYAGDDADVLRIGVSTPQLSEEDRPPVALTFVIDTSGSMNIRSRLGLVQASLAILVLELKDDDTISIVTYGDESEALLAPTPVSEAQTIVDAIDDLVPGGSTNMEAGLRTGYEQARDSFRDDGVNAVVLASDGVANVGVSGPDGLASMISDAGNDGIHLVTLGYGMGNYNDNLMEQLANQGDGFYRYLDTLEEAERLFIEELTPTLVLAAGDAKIQVNFDPDVVSEYRLIGYQNRDIADEDFTDDTVDAGEVGRGHHVTALYELRRIEGSDGVSVGSVDLRWADPDSGETMTATAELPAEVSEPSPHMLLAQQTAAAAEILAGEAVWNDRDVTLNQIAADARALASDHGLDGGEELADLLDTVDRLSSPPDQPDP